MHAEVILQKCFIDVFSRMHRARVRVVVGAVLALVVCRRLVLMELARAWIGAERVRAPLKRLDRLLSNAHIHAQLHCFYQQIARWCVRSVDPLIVVDWSTLKADESLHLLRAAIAVGGRTVTLYEEVHPQKTAQSPKVHRNFLRKLRRVLPPGCRPIIVTDAGFRCPWFSEVERLGWRWIGRVRNQVCVKLGENSAWRPLTALFAGVQKLQCFGAVQLARQRSLSCQMLRYRGEPRGRKHLNARKQISRSKQSRAAARAQSEPWLLAYCTELQHTEPMHIVHLYKKRMQIELSFRDLKSPRFGCAFRHSLTRKRLRVAVLLLLHALAGFIAWLQGVMLHASGTTGHCAIRTHSQPRYSIVRIGWESLRRNSHAPPGLNELTTERVPLWLSPHLIPTT